MLALRRGVDGQRASPPVDRGAAINPSGPDVVQVMGEPDTLAPADPVRQQCSKCDSELAKAVSLTESFVYIRCKSCGEVWVIPERRQLPRDGERVGR